MKRHHTLTVLLAWMAAAHGSAQAEPLGRLFFTPERRAAIERRQQANSAQPSPVDATTRLDGIVARSGGGATVWLNSRPRQAGSDGIALASGRVALTTGAGAPALLRVGETFDRETSHISDLIAGGSIHVGKAPAPSR